MIKEGILALMVLITVNAVLLVSGFVGDIDQSTSTIPGLPQGLTPSGGFNPNEADLRFVDTGIESTSTDLITTVISGVVTLVFSIPLFGDLLKAMLSVAALFFNFMFFWAVALNASGLPPILIYIISVPIAFFEYGILLFLSFQIFNSLITLVKP